MSLETRSNSAVFKRAEQLRRWEESDTNREATAPRNKQRKVKFSAGCVFLAACAAGEKEEVQRLIERGADINTTDEDEMTALHQACIDNNLEMVEFLVEHGADINKGDNEGWTPLHATSNCGFVSIARYLLENGANVAAANSDSELPIDVAMSDDMEDLLQEYINAQGIDCDEARSEEETLMLEDAKRWLNSEVFHDVPHPKTGATALHVAAAKGYIKVMSVLIQAGADINAQDNDGWTPLHAAAHWGQKEACELLVENLCDMEKKNFLDQNVFDVADTDMQRVLEDLKKKQATLQKDRGDADNIIENKGSITSKRRSSITRLSAADKSNLANKDATLERQALDRSISEEEENHNIKKVEVEIRNEIEHINRNVPVIDNEIAVKVKDEDSPNDSSESTDDSETSSDNETLNSDSRFGDEKKNKANKDELSRLSSTDSNKTVPKPPTSPPKIPTENDDSASSWRRPGSFRSRIASNKDELPNRTLTLRITEKSDVQKPPPSSIANHNSGVSEVVLRRTQSFEADEKFRRRYLELQARIKAGSCPSLHSSPLSSTLPTRSSSFRERHLLRHIRDDIRNDTSKLQSVPVTAVSTMLPTTSITTATTTVTTSPKTVTSPATSPLPTSQIRSLNKGNASPSTPSTPTTPGGSKLSPGNIFKNFFKSFVPPVRDEESETQRKAHAKRVRETRRSTQGVTLEEIKTAEQLVKKKNQQQQQLNNEQPSNTPSITATITTAVPTVPSSNIGTKDEGNIPAQERRPSWRLRVDNIDRSKFLLEDVRNKSSGNETANFIKRQTTNTPSKTDSSPTEEVPTDTTVTIALRRQEKPPDDKDQDKENDSRNVQATQGVIQRRRRPKRRSTGVVHMDMDELEADQAESPADEDSKIGESGNDHSNHSSRLNSVSSTSSSGRVSSSTSATKDKDNCELDYKKLYEEAIAENERLKAKLRDTEGNLREAQSKLEQANMTTRSSLSELEKRERRAMERKLSEMEEELKQLQKLKAENEKLKAENRALTRVVSKLTTTANATK